MKIILQFFVTAAIFWQIWSQDIAFPIEGTTNHVSGNIGNPGGPVLTERIPVHSPGQCPENMLLYPGAGNSSTWICDCRLNFVYFPDSDSCHELYKRGPCPLKQIVVLPRNEVIPKCIDNLCQEENQVPFNGTCSRIGSIGGICGMKGMLIINGTTYQLECMDLGVEHFVIINAPMKVCPPGSRRNSSGHCKYVL
ncbi:uncharacterized protein LOC127284857 [Leptopilina boulardi]|uniref:uncharacterized protein LOC127284857 n=1 Tax=Leptopilina boulardi TaxID=63433 RepID=UPI0021F69BE0|nr:uncharacterized protein LOC127284857 [Leptopilina boulardi]